MICFSGVQLINLKNVMPVAIKEDKYQWGVYFSHQSDDFFSCLFLLFWKGGRKKGRGDSLTQSGHRDIYFTAQV